MKVWQWYVLDFAVWFAIYFGAVELIDDKGWAVMAAMFAVSITRPALDSIKP